MSITYKPADELRRVFVPNIEYVSPAGMLLPAPKRCSLTHGNQALILKSNYQPSIHLHLQAWRAILLRLIIQMSFRARIERAGSRFDGNMNESRPRREGAAHDLLALRPGARACTGFCGHLACCRT